MPKIEYVRKRFSPETLAIICEANGFIADYGGQGYTLTLRQLYYRFIATDRFPPTWIDEAYNRKHQLAPDTKNTEKNYKRLGKIVSAGRKAGLIDWDAIEDRARNLVSVATWADPADIIRTAAESFRLDVWEAQQHRVECWVEKDAMISIVEAACRPLRVPYFACRGYVSDSELFDAAYRRLRSYRKAGKAPMILHLGDHDPSGIDMTRDIRDRLSLYSGLRDEIEVRRIALNSDQVEANGLPPNPAKSTDARFRHYRDRYGEKSWELDALEPADVVALIQGEIGNLIEPDAWEALIEREKDRRREIEAAASDWGGVVATLSDRGLLP